MSKTHQLTISNQHLHGSFSRDYQPILTIQSGDSVEFNTTDIGWGYNQENGERIRYESREKEAVWGHPIIGPFYVEGAKPGLTLEVKINELKPGWYGWNCSGGKSNWQNKVLAITEHSEITLNWQLDHESQTGTAKVRDQKFTVKLSPFLGVMATAPAEPGIHSTIPPRYCGGNIDCKELVEGSILYLPIAVEGALFSAGDGHAAQGDGEVSGQAIEAPFDKANLTLTVREDVPLKMPRAHTPAGWITFGFDEDLNQAAATALEGMVELIQEMYQLEKTEATALASVCVDLRITQVVNRVKGVHAILPHGAINHSIEEK
ncbi:acetamidase/formamidase family protein [Neobacillus terrae]|uniref:acetamidase/formamidase family protein n=1 Tax=Neobacillus terrae TaxID=3034837 RepID=UPI00140DADED|nr:acetamidase/formamidase family protein [Neobacillus terrae]NHM33788.1 acetamidase [Neobacillus terrae]